jgi:hypothetical protein
MQASPNAKLRKLRDAGVSIWLDTLSRELLEAASSATSSAVSR